MTNPPSGTITFLFTDIEGSTKRWEQHPVLMNSALAHHDSLLRQAIEAQGGYIFKTMGDAFCAAFSTAPNALNAACEAQRALYAEDGGEIGAIRVRMALHTGNVVERDGDYFGPPVNRVARLLSTGHGGQTLLSQPTFELVRDNLPPHAELLDMGEHRLKDLTRPEHIFQLVAPDLPADFPPLKTLDNRPNNLPIERSDIIGRERELDAAGRLLLRDNVGLVTLTGPGGTGKTRLALQLAANLLDQFKDGVFFVNLAPITDASLLVPTIAQTLGVRESGSQLPVDTLKAHLHDKQLFLVLDNFEQIVSAGPLVKELLGGAPHLKVLITSREPLRVRGEHEYPVPTLALPDPKHLPDLAAMSQYEAVALFIQRASEAKPDFAVTNQNAPALAEICTRLDGLPLAIELAAARIKLLPPEAMLSRLHNRMKMLTGGARDLPERQQTLRSTIAWSHDMLDEGEKQLFRRLAVFSGGRTLEAIEAVCNASGDLQMDVLDGVESLASKSLLRQVEGAAGEPRFWMLETIHEYAREMLEESGEGEESRKQHTKYFLALAEEAEPHLRGPEQAKWFKQVEDEHDNMRTALGWALEHGGTEIALRLSGALFWFWLIRGYLREGSRWLELSLAGGGSQPTSARALALRGAGLLAEEQGDYERADTLVEESLALYRELGDKQGLAKALGNVGDIATMYGNSAKAREVYKESLPLHRELENMDYVANTLNNLGWIAFEQGDFEQARTSCEESLALSRIVGNMRVTAEVLDTLGQVALAQQDYEQANLFAKESLLICKEIGSKRGVAQALELLAEIAGGQKQSLLAARLFGAGDALYVSLDAHRHNATQGYYERYLTDARAQLDEATWQAAWAQGRAMSMEQAVEYALEQS